MANNDTSLTVVVAGTGPAAAWAVDRVNAGVRLETISGNVYYRRVAAAYETDGNTTILFDTPVPDVLAGAVRRCSWMRVARFASDDLTIEWVTNTVAQAQVQAVTLPYAVAEVGIGLDSDTQDLVDYYGAAFFALFGDPLDYIVNVQEPRLSGYLYLNDWFTDGFQYIVNVQEPRLGD